MSLEKHLLTVARTYASASGQKLSYVGLRSAGHGGLFSRLEAGGSLTTKRYEKLIAWFRARWPEDVEWPAVDVNGVADGEQNAERS